MVLFTLGLPGRFAEWCDAVAVQLCRRAAGSVRAVSANAPEDIMPALVMADGAGLVVSARQPSAALLRALAETGARHVVCLEDARLAVADLIHRYGLGLAAAVRAVAASCASIRGHGHGAGALVLRASDGTHEPVHLARAIADHFGLAIDDVDIRRIVGDLAGSGIVPSAASDVRRMRELGRQEQALIDGALGAYCDEWPWGGSGALTWSRELFFIGDDPGAPATRAIDVTGRSRCLLFGPYIRVPHGTWTVRLVLGFSQEAAEIGYVVELVAGSVLDRKRIKPEREGRFEMAMPLSIAAAADDPIEIRVFSERPAFDGCLVMGFARLAQQARAPVLEPGDGQGS